MKRTVFLPILCFLLLVSLLAAPVLAATVTCPASCSCLLPDEAKKLGYSGYCSGTQAVCGYDSLKNEKYCYGKASATTTKTTTATTTVTKTAATPPVSQCPSGCSCLSAETGKGKGLPYCNGKQTVCGYDTSKNPLYCFSTAIATTTVTTTATPFVTCPSGCACLSTETGKLKGLSYCNGKQSLCGYDVTQVPLYCFATSVVTTTTATTVPSSCGAGCSCLLPDEAKAKGLSYCNGKQTVCAVPSVDPATGAATSSSDKYCYGTPAATCPTGCSCLAQDKAEAIGLARCSGSSSACSTDPLGRPMYCYVYSGTGATGAAAAGAEGTTPTPPAGSGVPINIDITQPPNAPGPAFNFVEAFTSFFAGLFGPPTAGEGVRSPTFNGSAVGPAAMSASCEDRFGMTSCYGGCADLQTNEQHCGACGNACYHNEICCGGNCVANTSAGNCGGCGNTCAAGSVCQDGRCDAWGCYFGNTPCNGACLDLQSDPLNCGACGNACPGDSRCHNGVCELCPVGTKPCGNRCVNPDTDRTNCGYCRNTCADDAICAGSCTPCTDGTTRCSNACVDLQTDNANCGTCGYPCPAGSTCVNGECGCADPAQSYCIYSHSCVNTLTDRMNCGYCGNRCGSDEMCCNGVCANFNTDAANCGGCGIDCGSGSTGPGYCDRQVCAHCPYGTYRCGTGPAATCQNIQNDPENCGACGNHCASGENCCGGTCYDPDTSEQHCGACMNPCGSGQQCCGGVCTNVLYNEDHCGSCSNHCIMPGREHCIEGRCCNAAGGNCL